MATGDTSDFVRRLRAALPRRWFPDDAPVLTGVLTGIAAVWAGLYSVLVYTMAQTRINTATGIFLDIVASDFFAGRISRFLSESDTHFRRRIKAEILRPRATRAAVAQALFDLTGIDPVIFEPANATDTGGYNVGGIGYNTAGGWGSLMLPFQAFISAFRPSGGGIANVSGYGNIAIGIEVTGSLGGYGQGAIQWADLEMVQGAITDADIYSTVAAAMPAATIGWTRGLAATPPASQPQILRPAAAFSRTMSSARGAFVNFAGALLTAFGRGTALGQLAASASATTLIAAGLSRAAGTLLPQAGVLNALGRASAAGRVAALIGAGILRGRGGAAAFARSSPLTGTTALRAAGIARAAGNFLFGAVIILPGRATAMAQGVAVATRTAAPLARSKAAAAGVAVLGLVGGVSLVMRATGRGMGRFTPASLAALLSATGRSSGKGRSTIATQQAAPTAPSNVVASNATPNTMTLTWSPSTGAP